MAADPSKINRTALAQKLSDDLGITKSEADKFIVAFQNRVTTEVASGNVVNVAGFMKFARVERPARMGRNPATGESIKIKASTKVRVTPLKAFKDAVMAGAQKKGKKTKK